MFMHRLIHAGAAALRPQRDRWHLRHGAAVLALLLLGACSGGDSDEPTEVASSSATIGAAGGTVQGPDGVQLVVPPGALSADTTIRIARTAEGAPALPEDLRPDLTLYEITPHDLQFAVPAQLRLPMNEDPTETTTVMAASRGGDWSTVLARFEGRMAVIDRTSLSWFNISTWGGSTTCRPPSTNTDPHPCQPTTMQPGQILANPAGALSTNRSTVTAATTLTMPVTFGVPRDCGNARLVVTRTSWDVNRPAGTPQTVYDAPMVMTPVGSNRATGSATVSADVTAADNGTLHLRFSFTCTRSYNNRRASATGSLLLNVAAPVPADIPKITEEPANLGVPAGTVAVFTVRASAPQGLSVRWQRSEDSGVKWSDLGAGAPLADGSRYSLTAAPADDGVLFRAQVCNGTGVTQTCIDSSAAALSITPVLAAAAPVFTLQPASQPWVANGTIVFRTAASGTPAPDISWSAEGGSMLAVSGRYTSGACSFDYSSIAGTLTLTNVTSDCIRLMFCARAVNSAGSALSNCALLESTLPVATLYAGTPGSPGSEDSPNARFFVANYVAMNEPDGRVAVGDFGNNSIRVVAQNGVVSTLAGGAGAGYADGSGSAARFNGNAGVAFDSAGNLIVADWENHVLRRITPAGVVTTIAGAAGQAGVVDGTGSAARFSNPNGLVVDSNDNIWVADWSGHTIRRVTPAGVVTTMAGQAGQPGSADGLGAAARFNLPSGLARDALGNVYVADQGNHTVRRVDWNGAVTTVAGSAGQAGTVDGAGAAARFDTPAWIAATTDGRVFVVSDAGDTVRRIDFNGNVSTVVGVRGQNSAVRTGYDPRLRNARGLWVSPDGMWLLLAADHALLYIDLP